MDFLAIIPARYASTRFPGKPLVDIRGKSMIQRVYERGQLIFPNIVVATDDSRIFNHVVEFGGMAVMTSADHINGTSRICEAVKIIEKNQKREYSYIINIQGDEPFISKDQLIELKNSIMDEGADISTLCKKITDSEELFSPNNPKVVMDCNFNALYFSRSVIPYTRDIAPEKWIENTLYYKHIGLYAFKRTTLDVIENISQTPLEKAESLEQLRWLENGLKIRLAITNHLSYSIDTPEDLKNLLASNIL